jgi:drug/metabolite transporter (DMT)-like permease
MALGGEEADPVGFTTIRLISGAVTLTMICGVTGRPIRLNLKKTYYSGLYLFLYAFLFSLAYVSLSAGIGALILFGSVQLTMVGISVYRGNRPLLLEWLGLVVAIGGLVYLVSPGLSAPPLAGALFMAGAGAAWGLYTLKGKTSDDPISDTNSNFVVAVIAMLIVLAAYWQDMEMSRRGILLAVLSGAIASGVGYAVWYAVLKHHTATRAAVLQLSVPVIAAFGGVMLLSELMTRRLLIGAALILGGIAVTILGRQR